MQKHERLALEAAREVAVPAGCSVSLELASRNHPKLVLEGPRGTRKYSVSCSPKNRDAETSYARQWARRAVGEVA